MAQQFSKHYSGVTVAITSSTIGGMALIMIDNEYSTPIQPPFATREANGILSELFMSKYKNAV